MKIAISLDSSSDLTEEIVKEFDFHIVPFNIQLGDRSMFDGEIPIEEMFDYVEKTGTLPKTSAVNEYQYKEHFNKLLNSGYDAIIHFSISSKLSSTFSNAERAAAEIKNVYVIDSKTLSAGIGMAAMYCKELVEKGLDIAEIIKKVNNRVSSIQVCFTLEKTNYLYKGGRCSFLAFLGANLLRIRPQIVLKDGIMVVGKKFRGPLSLVVSKCIESTLSEFCHPDKSILFLVYTTWDKDDVNRIVRRLEEYGFKKIFVSRAHATVATHCGPHTIGIGYFNDHKDN